MDKRKTKIVDKIISGMNWDSILQVNRFFNLGTGEGIDIIPGIKRKPFSDKLTKNDLKNELKTLIKHVLDNNIAEFSYGPWLIFWMDSNWVSFQLDDSQDYDEEDEGGNEESNDIQLSIDSTLEVIYSPQRMFISFPPDKESEENREMTDIAHLEIMLEKALKSEKYELASKIKDLITLQKEDPIEDK
jgi:hypothetical protein